VLLYSRGALFCTIIKLRLKFDILHPNEFGDKVIQNYDIGFIIYLSPVEEPLLCECGSNGWSDSSVKILITDDQELSRTGLRYSLKDVDGIDHIDEAENGQQAIRAVENSVPDIILMDISMPEMNGILATKQIKAQHPEVKIIMLTSSHSEEEIYGALSAGADGFCLKNIKISQLRQIMDVVSHGGIWLDPAIAASVIKTLPSEVAPSESQFDKTAPSLSTSVKAKSGFTSGTAASRRSQADLQTQLTSREWEVLKLIAQGKSNKEIATELVVTVHTVKIHVSSIIQKLAVTDRTQAAIKALQEGWVNSQQSLANHN
jgi:DNA-binding NarL/FixJ family response regulator